MHHHDLYQLAELIRARPWPAAVCSLSDTPAAELAGHVADGLDDLAACLQCAEFGHTEHLAGDSNPEPDPDEIITRALESIDMTDETGKQSAADLIREEAARRSVSPNDLWRHFIWTADGFADDIVDPEPTRDVRAYSARSRRRAELRAAAARRFQSTIDPGPLTQSALF